MDYIGSDGVDAMCEPYRPPLRMVKDPFDRTGEQQRVHNLAMQMGLQAAVPATQTDQCNPECPFLISGYHCVCPIHRTYHLCGFDRCDRRARSRCLY